MAYWKRLPHGVVVWATGGKRRLPRTETRHLDSQPDHNIEAWVQNWELAHEGRRSEGSILDDAALIALLDRYLAYVKAEGRKPPTLAWHRQMLRDYVLPFFANYEPRMARPDEWPDKSIRMLPHLQELELPHAALFRATTAAKLFWKWLCEEGVVMNTQRPFMLRTPRQPRQATPLQFTATPADILAFVTTTGRREIKLMALLGYFFSLRPQETFALRAKDFVAGSRANALECCNAMGRMHMFDRLAVHIHRQLTQARTFDEPKAHSVGYVACFERKAAAVLLPLLNGMDPEALLIAHSPDWAGKHWRKYGYPGLTLKDLRRASIYHLGHHTEFVNAPLLLQKHARHSDFETTQLYLRRPEEPEAEWIPLDLDA